MTPAEVITEARRLIQDTREPYRYTDAVLLGFVNQTLKRMVILRPDLFSVIAEFPTAEGNTEQTCPADSMRLVEIFSVKDGNAITEVDRQTLDRTVPMWKYDTPGQPVNFMRHPRNPNTFFVYPAPEEGVVLIGEYAQTPPDYTINQEIATLPDTYIPALVDGVVFLAESIDNEHVNSGRAKLFQDSFTQTLLGQLQAKSVTDSESGQVSTRRQ